LLLIGVLFGVAIAAATQNVLNDQGMSNTFAFFCGAVGLLLASIMSLRALARRTSTAIALGVGLVLVMLPISLFRLRGFSGAMMPIVESRFKSSSKLKETIVPSELADAVVTAESAFPQFLGPDRNAVITERIFDIPSPSGKDPIWRINIGEGWGGFSILGEHCVTLEQRGADECVSAYHLGTGELIWISKTPARHENIAGGIGPRSTPTIVDDMVYTQGATGIVKCLRLASGEVVWRQDLLALGGWTQTESEAAISWGRAASPLLVDGLCIVPFGRNRGASPDSDLLAGRSLIALDAASGEVRWTGGDDQISYASAMKMTFDGVDQVVSVNESTISGHGLADGKTLWSAAWEGQSNGGANCASALAIGTTDFLAAKGYGVGSARFTVAKNEESNGWDVTEVWSNHRILKTKFTHACIDGEIAYALSDETLECIDLRDGSRLWPKSRAAQFGHGHVIQVGDVLIVQTESGDVTFVAADPVQFKILATIDALSSKTWNIPAIAGSFLLCRNDAEAVLYRLNAYPDFPTTPAPTEPPPRPEATPSTASAKINRPAPLD